MISTFTAIVEPSQAVTGLAVSGLLVLLIASQLADNEGSPFYHLARHIQVFSSPLLVMFVMVVLIRIIRIII